MTDKFDLNTRADLVPCVMVDECNCIQGEWPKERMTRDVFKTMECPVCRPRFLKCFGLDKKEPPRPDNSEALAALNNIEFCFIRDEWEHDYDDITADLLTIRKALRTAAPVVDKERAELALKEYEYSIYPYNKKIHKQCELVSIETFETIRTLLKSAAGE